MGRILTEIDVAEKKCWTLFDSGARKSYITRGAAAGLDVQDLPTSRAMSLGGTVHQVQQACLVFAQVEGRPVEFQANLVDEIGADADGRPIDVLFGALAMQLWNIKLDVSNERLDLSHLTKDFVEF